MSASNGWINVPDSSDVWSNIPTGSNVWSLGQGIVSDLDNVNTFIVDQDGAIYQTLIGPDHFIVLPNVSPNFIIAAAGDTVDLPYAIDYYTITGSGTFVYFKTDVETVAISVSGKFTLRTASGSTSVELIFDIPRIYMLFGDEYALDLPSFDALASIQDPSNVSLIRGWQSVQADDNAWQSVNKGTNTWLQQG